MSLFLGFCELILGLFWAYSDLIHPKPFKCSIFTSIIHLISLASLLDTCMKGGSKGIPFKNPVSCQTEKLMAGTKFSDSLGLKHYKEAKK